MRNRCPVLRSVWCRFHRAYCERHTLSHRIQLGTTMLAIVITVPVHPNTSVAVVQMRVNNNR